MSVLLGVPSRSIRYLNIHREGTGNNETCDVDSQWSNPILQKQDDYLVAITRFEVPMNRVPITQKLTNCIEIFKYHMGVQPQDPALQLNQYPAMNIADNQNLEDLHANNVDIENRLRYYEAIPGANVTEHGISIDVEPCHTIYKFLQVLNAKITEVLLYTANPRIEPVDANNANLSPLAAFRNGHVGTDQNGNQSILNTTNPIAHFSISMDNDFTFSVNMNALFAEKYYIKMSPALFNMLGFKEGTADGNFRTQLIGRRFIGSRNCDKADPASMKNQEPAYFDHPQNVVMKYPRDGITQTPIRLINGQNPVNLTVKQTQLSNITIEDQVCKFTAPVSAADTINRCKAIVFSSSMATTSEGATGNSYRRELTDYTIPVQTSFSFDPQTLKGSGINENAASEYTYVNANPSAGRFLQISDPSPLYELKLSARVKCWNFELNRFEFEAIPLPIAGTFSVKLVFISRTELHRRERPDKLTE